MKLRLIAIACILGYLDFRFPHDGSRRGHAKLAAWCEEFEKLPSAQATKPPAR